MHVVLVQPEIPQNTGSVARLCAATASPLHLVGKLGFSLEDRYLRRAGLDYWPLVDLHVHANWEEFIRARPDTRRFAFSSHDGPSYTTIEFRDEDALIFGGESRGLPDDLRQILSPTFRIPMPGSGVRSLNLANAASVVLYEGLRQLGRLEHGARWLPPRGSRPAPGKSAASMVSDGFRTHQRRIRSHNQMPGDRGRRSPDRPDPPRRPSEPL